jgi:hypothetical protein
MPTSMPDAMRPRQEFPTPLFKATLVVFALVFLWFAVFWIRIV